jgi:polysaccharide biosynthesis/export protein
MMELPSLHRRSDPQRGKSRAGSGSRGSDRMLTLSLGPLVLALCALVIAGCAASASRGDVKNGSQASNMSPEQCLSAGAIQASNDPQNYHIQPGDQLAINFYLNPEFNDEVPVSPDGHITLRLIGSVPAAGLTPSQLAAQLDKAYLSELRSPDAAVIVKNMPGRQVYVQGQVNHPGAFPLEPGMTALQALADAGGVTSDAADDSVVLIRRDACGRPTGERLDLASAVDNPSKGEDAALMPYDVLVVPRSRIANMDLFVQQYIRGLLPVEPYFSLTPGI